MVTPLPWVSAGETALARGWGLISARAVPEDALSRAPNHYAGIKRQNRVGAPLQRTASFFGRAASLARSACHASAGVPGLGGAPAGSPAIQLGISATGLLPVLGHAVIMFVMANISMRLGFIASAPALIGPLLEHARMAPAADTQFQN
jgi:hypothetical protein